MEGARLYLEAETDKDNTSMREVKIHFCDFIRIMIKNFSRKYKKIYYVNINPDFNVYPTPSCSGSLQHSHIERS